MKAEHELRQPSDGCGEGEANTFGVVPAVPSSVCSRRARRTVVLTSASAVCSSRNARLSSEVVTALPPPLLPLPGNEPVWMPPAAAYHPGALVAGAGPGLAILLCSAANRVGGRPHARHAAAGDRFGVLRRAQKRRATLRTVGRAVETDGRRRPYEANTRLWYRQHLNHVQALLYH